MLLLYYNNMHVVHFPENINLLAGNFSGIE